MKQTTVLKSNGVLPVQAILQPEYLRESNILNLLPSAVYVCNQSGVIVNYNHKAVQLWGRTPKKGDKDEMFCGAFKLYRSDGSYMPHDETPVAVCLIDGIPKEDIEVVIERPDLSRVTVRVNIVPVKDEQGAVLGAINCFYDITHQKETQRELDWRTKQLHDYVENAAIGLHWVDSKGIIKWANKAELDMLGYTEEEYVGHHISEFHVKQEKIRDILHRLSCNETLNQYESELRCKDGSIKTVHISSNVFREEGKFIHTRCFTIDVSFQKKLLLELQESESRYKTLVNTIPAAIYSCDKDGRISFFNEQAVQLWGYRPNINDDTVKFCACFKVMTPSGVFIPPEKTPMAICLQTGKPFRNVEALVERPDGSKFYACVNIDPIFDENNNLTGAINIFQDISTLKETELALSTSESQYRNLIDSLVTPLYTTDPEGRITLYNQAAADLWGREPEIGKDMWCGSYKIFNPDGSNLPLEECPMAVCLKEKRAVSGAEILVVRADGSVRNVAPHPQPVFDNSGNMTGAINMLVDITSIKSAELALRESEKKYRELAASLEKMVEEKTFNLKLKNEELKRSEEKYHKMVDEVEDYAIILLDKDGIIRNWNKGAEKIKGYKEQEIIGKSFTNFYLPENLESGLPEKFLQEATEKGKANHEGWRLRKDGTRFWANTVLTALHDDKNNIIGFSKVTRDLTERKIAEDKMLEYTRQLEFQNKELEQFAYAASHDMKEPLRKIHLYYSYVAENPENILDEKSLDYLGRSIKAVRRMNELIEDLLNYSKTTYTKENIEEVDLNEVLEEIMLELKEEFEYNQIDIRSDYLPIVSAIPFQMKQLISNLVSNSIKYRKPGKAPDIQIRTTFVHGSEIGEWGADPYRPYHKISLTDNGIGFNMLHAEKIFDIFQRLNNLPGATGSGIGLAICKRIVQNHHGFIKASGKENEGARFDIYLPKSL